MSNETKLSTPMVAREHARSQAGKIVEAMPTIPASSAKNLPPGVNAQDVLWDETIAEGEYCSRILKRGSRLRIENLKGDACVNFLVYNADRPIERLNVADTVKVQWNGYIGKSAMLLSDMGRVLMSFLEDTCQNHDTFCGPSSEKSNAKKYGTGANYSPHPSAMDRFLLALTKYGLGKKDIPPNINLFKNVRVAEDGGLKFTEASSRPGDFVELRAEMNVLVVAANTPHVLDPRKDYVCTPARFTAYRGEITPENDPLRIGSPESLRAFQNTEDYFLS